jgi:hypothetical protein
MFTAGFRHMRRPPSEWADRCDVLDLLSLEGEYISFITDLENEITILEHLQSCQTCRTSIRETTRNNRAATENLWSMLLSNEGEEGFEEPIDARIRLRLGKLRGIRADAVIELTDLRERLKEHR